jgi:PAS domain S-box-containing protein
VNQKEKLNNSACGNLIDTIQEAVILTDENHLITGWNNAAEKIYGWQANEVIGQPRSEVLGTLHPDGRIWDEKVALARDFHWDGEVIQRTRDNVKLIIHSRVDVNRSEKGSLMGFTFINRDITHEKILAENLALKDAEFKALTEALPELVWLADERGQTYWYNQRWLTYTGTSINEMAGNGWQKVHNPDYLPRLMARIGTAFKKGEPWEDVFPLKGKDGKFRMFLTRAVPIRDSRGKIARWLGTNTDINELRDAREALKERDENYRRLVDNLQEGFAIFETAADETGKAQDLRFAEINNSFENMSGMTRNHVLGNSIYALYPEDASLFFEQVREAESTGKSRQFRWTSPVNNKSLLVTAYVPQPGIAVILLSPPGKEAS